MERVKELLEKVNNTTKKTKLIALICAVVSSIAAIAIIVGVHKKKNNSKNVTQSLSPEDFDDEYECDEDGFDDEENGEDDAEERVVCLQPVNLFMCGTYDSDYSNPAAGNCSAKCGDCEMAVCEDYDVPCKCVKCFLSLANGGPCVHCSKCNGNPLTPEGEKEEAKEEEIPAEKTQDIE